VKDVTEDGGLAKEQGFLPNVGKEGITSYGSHIFWGFRLFGNEILYFSRRLLE
jgi:hypothetical protein